MTLKHVLVMVEHHFYNCLRFFKNIYTFRKTLYNTTSWDFAGYFLFMDEMLTQQIALFESDRTRTSSAKHKAKKMRIIRELVRRQHEGWKASWWDYQFSRETGTISGFHFAGITTTKKSSVVPSECKESHRVLGSIEKYEWDYLMKLLSKHLNTFWD